MAENKYSESTQELLDTISKEKDLDFDKYRTILKDSYVKKPLGEILTNLFIEKNAIYSTVQNDLGMSKSYFYDLLNGKKKNPSRDIILAIMFELHCTIDEFQSVLKQAGYPPLYIKDERDSIIFFAAKKEYTLDETNLALAENNFPIIKTVKDSN